MKKISIFLYLFSLKIYILTIAPTVYLGDSAEFSTTSFLLDISHPPSYPLYNLLVKLFAYLPIENVAIRCNLFSAYFSGLTAILIFLIVLYLPLNWDKASKFIVSFFSSLVFAFSLTFWQHSIKAEVYTLYVFLFALIIFILLLYNERNDIRYSYLAGLVFCFSLTNHLLIILSFVPFLFFILTHNYKILLNKRNFIILFLFSAMAFSIYLYLPLRSAKETKINWGRPQTIEDFKYIILLKEQGKLHIPQEEMKKDIKIKESELRREFPFIFKKNLLIIFVFLLPLYFSFLLTSKKKYSTFQKIIFVLLSLLLIMLPLLTYFFHEMFSLSSRAPSLVENLKKSFFTAFYREFLWLPFFLISISILMYLSLAKRYENITIKLLLFTVFVITILIYTVGPGLNKGYKAGEFSSFIYLDIFIKQFSIYLFPLGILGLIKLYSENLRVFAFLFFLFIASGPLPILLIMPDNIPLVQERFSLPAYFIYSIFIGFGVKAIMDFFQKYTKLNYKYFYPLLIFSLIPLFLNFKETNKSKYYFTKNYVEDIFLTLPKNSIVLAKGIDTVFPLWYFSFVDKKRSDVTIVYIDALGQKWYIDNLKENTNLVINNLEKKVTLGSPRKTLYIENLIKNNINGYPIYYGGAPLFIPEGIKGGTVIPEGILFKIIKSPKNRLTPDEIKRNEQLLKSYKFTKLLTEIDYFAENILSIYAAGYFKLAVNLSKQSETIEYLEKAMKIDKSFAPPYLTLYQIYYGKGNIKDAEKILKEGIKNNPKNINLIFELSHLYFNIGNSEESINLLDKIIKLKPEFVLAYLAKAQILITIGEKEEGRKILREILKMEPDNQRVINILKQLN